MSRGSLPNLDSLPYADQYMRDILRPRVERALQLVDRSMTESVWQHVVRLLAADQPTGNEETPAMIRKILEEHLGLRIEARVHAAFDGPSESAPPPPSATVGPSPREKAEVVVRTNPLLKAVMNSTR